MYEFMRHKILLLGGCARCAKYKNITVQEIYRFAGKRDRMLFKLQEHMAVGDMSRWYGEWREHTEDFDVVIVFDGIRGSDVIEYIRKKNPRARIVVYYVNIFAGGDRNDPARFKKFGVEMFTFDRAAAERHNIGFRHYFYEHEEEAEAAKKNAPGTECDIVFFGSDKGRLPYLIKLKDTFADCGAKTELYVVPDKRRSYTKSQREFLLNGWQPYEKIVAITQKARAVLDLNVEEQTGITLRPMESIFLGKKLITNNRDIRNYDFYDKRNVFITDEDDYADLGDFLHSGFVPVDEKIMENYRMEHWLESFFR